ncbi:MAG: hypothetical protein UU41_C0020G0003 [Candidatus Roizmanbacteria bacterium GW2011_GWA1_41_13]|uniref:Pyridoxamine 5'-phosphate oxidase N-terminal domain-containing protein n=1 Tax=Candidatus Roizmanbacteria bacterium GW2011_GWA1_41_13 TaxID=1618474 RepID=A0A0G0UXC9_9BACT|nr:MAG: hypothetical protein UU41_C0020G0003 [Candidatus Roizmanbacteria bacterium GW2011_GWA1_41_13]
MDRKQVILDFIKKQKLAVISTVGIDNKPESAVLEFGETEELELIFDTLTSSRKYKNLQTNKNVSFVVGWDENITVQYEGIAEEVKEKMQKRYQQAYWNKNPKAQRWESTEGITYFKVAPKWIRYSDLNKNPWDVFEINI